MFLLFCYWTVHNFYALLAIYGFGLGFAIGIAYSAPISMGILFISFFESFFISLTNEERI